MENTKGKILVIAEKPSMGRDIAKVIEPRAKQESGYLVGDKYVITWAIGHLVGLSLPITFCSEPWNPNNLPIIPSKFTYDLPTESGKKAQISLIKKLLQNCNSAINACDAGREGEAIFRYIVTEGLGINKPSQRLWINSLTETAIKEGFSNLKPLSQYDNLYNSAVCRDQSDWIIGMGVGTPAITYKVKQVIPDPSVKYISIGRVFTPTFAMVCKRYHEHSNFTPEAFYKVKFAVTKDELLVHFITKDSYKTIDHANKIKEGLNKLIVTSVEVKEKSDAPPLLFDLTSLQQEANKKFGFSADDTLKTAQTLYESKLITYPRTDSKYINEDLFESVYSLLSAHIEEIPLFLQNSLKAKEYASMLISEKKFNKKCVNDNKVTDHHAILPTPNLFNLKGEKEKQLYSLILQRSFEAFGENNLRDITTILAAPYQLPGNDTTFRLKGELTTYLGFKTFREKEEPEEDSQILPFVQLNEILEPTNIYVHEDYTKPKPLYTEAGLLGAMENCGKDMDDEDVKEALKGSGIGTPATRASIIEKLFYQKLVNRKGKSLIPTTLGLWLYDYIKDLKISSAELTGEWEHKLELIKEGKFSPTTFKEEISVYAKELTSEILNLNIKSSQSLDNSLAQDTLTCPKCKGRLMKGKKGTGCSNWNRAEDPCNFVIWNSVAGKKLTDKNIQDLVNKGKTAKIKGFKSKVGKAFDAELILDESYKVTFKF